MVTEGLRLVAEVARSCVPIWEVFVTSEYLRGTPEAASLVDTLAPAAVIVEVSDEVMAAMAETVTPQGILAVSSIPDLAPVAGEAFTLIPDQVRDPGNLGTMLRTAWAAGVTQILLPHGTVDYTNPKVVRAGMGAHFHLPIHTLDWTEIWERLASARVWLAEARRGQSYETVDWRGETALVVGGEATGAGRGARSGAEYVHIPMAPGVESLNAAVAASILLFEAYRQRRGA